MININMSDIGAEIGLREPLEDIKKRIISKLPDHLPSYQRAQRNMVGIDRGSFNRATLWNDSPEGVAIHSREIGGPSFDLLRPIRDKVTTYDEGAGSSDSLLEFVRGQGVDATSYLTAKPVTVSEAEIADDASIPNSFKGTKWHEKNMAYTTNGGLKTHYLIDREGRRTIVVEELVVNPWKNPGSFGERGQKKAAARLVDEMPQIKSYAERDGHYFKVLGAMTYDDLSFYEEALDAYIDVTDPRTKVGKLVGDKGKEFLGYVNKKWRKIVHRTTQNPAVVIDKASSHHEETPKSDSLGEALNTLFEKEYFSLKELQEPVFQRFITDPEVPVEQITDIFINTRGVIPDAFAAYQYF
ncbi:MAG TPA: hypothetical protein VF810_02885, partial [Patescibacteria group bacterium]